MMRALWTMLSTAGLLGLTITRLVNCEADKTIDQTKLASLIASCAATSIHVQVKFERPFDGIIYSKGAFYTPECVYVLPGTGEKEYAFDIPLNQCGTTEDKTAADAKKGERLFENTLVMQNDAHFQDILDVVRRIRCSTASLYEKIVDFSPINVNMKDVVTASFTSDDVRVSIDVQNGRGPFAQSLNQGFTQIGDIVTLVVYMTAESGQWDIHVRECVASDGQERASLTLQDKSGCLSKPKIMSPFALTRDKKNPKMQIAYSYIKAFRFPDDMQVQIKCVVSVCRDECEKPNSCGTLPSSEKAALSGSNRTKVEPEDDTDNEEPTITTSKGWAKRSSSKTTRLATKTRPKREVASNNDSSGTLPVRRIFHVISPEDIENLKNSSVVFMDSPVPLNSLCLNQAMFVVLLAILFVIIISTSVALTVTCLRNRTLRKIDKSIGHRRHGSKQAAKGVPSS